MSFKIELKRLIFLFDEFLKNMLGFLWLWWFCCWWISGFVIVVDEFLDWRIVVVEEDEEEHEGKDEKKQKKIGVNGSPLHTMVIQSNSW